MNLHPGAWVSHRAVAAALTVLLHALFFAALLHVSTRAVVMGRRIFPSRGCSNFPTRLRSAVVA